MIAPVISLATFRKHGVVLDVRDEPTPARILAALEAKLLGTTCPTASPREDTSAASDEIVMVVAGARDARKRHLSGAALEAGPQPISGFVLCGAMREGDARVTTHAHRVTCERCRLKLEAEEARRAAARGEIWLRPELVRLRERRWRKKIACSRRVRYTP